MSSTTRPLTPRHAAATILIALSVACVSACSVSIGGGSGDQGVTATGSQETSSPEQSATASQPSPTMNDSQAPRSETTAPSTLDSAAPAASGGTGAPGAGAQPTTGGRPGAQATITDSDWLSDLEKVDRNIAAAPSMLLDMANDDVRIEGDVENLTVSADNVTVFVDYVGLLTVTGTNAEVYVKDIDHVVVRGTGAEVVWAGSTPRVEDFGRNTETRRQGTRSS